MQFQDVRSFLDSVLSEDIHAKRVDSLANAALGVMTGASLAVAMIGRIRGMRGMSFIMFVCVSASGPGLASALGYQHCFVTRIIQSECDVIESLRKRIEVFRQSPRYSQIPQRPALVLPHFLLIVHQATG